MLSQATDLLFYSHLWQMAGAFKSRDHENLTKIDQRLLTLLDDLWVHIIWILYNLKQGGM
jgi:hypothetical protein